MSGSQKFVFVISILNIIGGVILIGLGLFFAFAGGSASGGEDALALMGGGLLLGLVGLFEIIGGIIGIRAARDATKSGLFYAISLISLILSIVGIIVSIATAGFHFANLTSIILPALMFYCAGNIRKQGQNFK